MSITVALGAQYILGSLLFQPDREWGHGVVSRHTTAPMLCRGGKGGHFFRVIMQMWNSTSMGWNLEGSLAFDMRFDDERAKRDERRQENLAFSFLFTFFFFWAASHHVRDAKEHWELWLFSKLTILLSQLKDEDRTQHTTVFISLEEIFRAALHGFLDACIGESEHLNRVLVLTSHVFETESQSQSSLLQNECFIQALIILGNRRTGCINNINHGLIIAHGILGHMETKSESKRQ
jgi:hypothetical protein